MDTIEIKRDSVGLSDVPGFELAAVACDIRGKGDDRLDLALIHASQPCNAAGVFTKNAVKAPPVRICQDLLGKGGPFHGIVVNSGNANACTGTEGLHDGIEMGRLTEKATGCSEGSYLVCSTGRIGEYLPMDRIRAGIGYEKSVAAYGAFPTDPYSHTPKHAGARQPGMTGQVKEEILTRCGELGVRVSDGAIRFQPKLLRRREFIAEPRDTGYVDVDDNWQTISVPPAGLAFTWCQVPIVYKLDNDAPVSLKITRRDGSEELLPQLDLPAAQSAEIFERSGAIRHLTLNLHSSMLFAD